MSILIQCMKPFTLVFAHSCQMIEIKQYLIFLVIEQVPAFKL